MNNNVHRTAAIYARVSSEGDRQNTDRQVVDLQAYAASAGLEVARIFTEKASGARDDRPVLAECLATGAVTATPTSYWFLRYRASAERSK